MSSPFEIPVGDEQNPAQGVTEEETVQYEGGRLYDGLEEEWQEVFAARPDAPAPGEPWVDRYHEGFKEFVEKVCQDVVRRIEESRVASRERWEG